MENIAGQGCTQLERTMHSVRRQAWYFRSLVQPRPGARDVWSRSVRQSAPTEIPAWYFGFSFQGGARISIVLAIEQDQMGVFR